MCVCVCETRERKNSNRKIKEPYDEHIRLAPLQTVFFLFCFVLFCFFVFLKTKYERSAEYVTENSKWINAFPAEETRRGSNLL